MTQKIKTPKRLSEVLNPKVKSEKKFKDKHVTIKHKDPAGNGDDVFNASNIKTATRMKDNHGYDAGGQDEKVYEATRTSDYKLIPVIVNGKVVFKKMKKDIMSEDLHSNTIHVQHITGKVSGKKFKVPTNVEMPHDEKHIARHNVHLNPKDVKVVAHHLKKLLEEKSCKDKKKKKLEEGAEVQLQSSIKGAELSDGARELINHANNMEHLKRAQRPFIENARRRIHKGVYDNEKGKKLWHNYAKHVALSYHAEYMPHEDLKKSLPNYRDDIKQVASHFEKKHRYAIQNGLHESALWYSELTEENKDRFDALIESQEGLSKVLSFIDDLENINEETDSDTAFHVAQGKKYKLPVKGLKNSIGIKSAFFVNKSGRSDDFHKAIAAAGFKKVEGGSQTSDHAHSSTYQHSDGTTMRVSHTSYDKLNHHPIYFKVPKKKGK